MARLSREGGLRVRIEGVDEVLEEIEVRKDKAEDLRLPFRSFDQREADPFVQRQFRTAGTFGQEPWDPIQPESVASRAENKGGPRRPLWDTATLKESLEQPGPQAVRVYQRDRMVHGTNVPWAFQGRPDGPRPIFPDPWPRSLKMGWETTLKGYFDGSGPFAGL